MYWPSHTSDTIYPQRDAGITPVVLHEFDDLQASFREHQYYSDHTDSCVEMVFQIKKGELERLIFDQSIFMDGSCARQPLRLKELWEGVPNEPR